MVEELTLMPRFLSKQLCPDKPAPTRRSPNNGFFIGEVAYTDSRCGLRDRDITCITHDLSRLWATKPFWGTPPESSGIDITNLAVMRSHCLVRQIVRKNIEGQ